MLTKIKNEPVMLVAFVLIVANLLWGLDPTEANDLIESAAVLAGGLLARSQVTPVNKLEGNQ